MTYNLQAIRLNLQSGSIIIFNPPLYIDCVEIKSASLVPSLNGKICISQNYTCTSLTNISSINGCPIEINVEFRFKSNHISALDNLKVGNDVELYVELKNSNIPNKIGHEFYFTEMRVVIVIHEYVDSAVPLMHIKLRGIGMFVGQDAEKMFKERMRKRATFIFR